MVSVVGFINSSTIRDLCAYMMKIISLAFKVCIINTGRIK